MKLGLSQVEFTGVSVVRVMFYQEKTSLCSALKLSFPCGQALHSVDQVNCQVDSYPIIEGIMRRTRCLVLLT